MQAKISQIGSSRTILHRLYDLFYVRSFGSSSRVLDKFDGTPGLSALHIFGLVQMYSPANVQDTPSIASNSAHSHCC